MKRCQRKPNAPWREAATPLLGRTDLNLQDLAAASWILSPRGSILRRDHVLSPGATLLLKHVRATAAELYSGAGGG